MMAYPGQQFDELTKRLVFPSEHQNPTPKSRYHLVVVGAGPAGLIASISAAGLGARVALIESRFMGGDCLNVGCVPSKALLESTKSETCSFDEAFEWLREVRSTISEHDSVERYSQAGVDVFLGEANFNESGELMVEGQVLRARRIALCVGAGSMMPPIEGLDSSDVLTNETVFDLRVQPKSLAILGAGPIGCELATVFSRFGSEVHLLDMADRVLPQEHPRAGEVVERALLDLGVNLHLGLEIKKISTSEDGKRVLTDAGEFVTEEVLIALGRRPNTKALALESVGVMTDSSGAILVDDRLRTSNKKIYAAGDCVQGSHFTHQADMQARVLVQNSLFLPSASIQKFEIPHCTYTSPEVASIGPSDRQLNHDGVRFDEYEIGFSEVDRARVANQMDGFARVLTRKGSDAILSATIVGKDAGEQIALISLLMNNKMGLSKAGNAVFSYPTRSEFLRKLSDAYNKTRLTPGIVNLLKRWLKWTV